MYSDKDAEEVKLLKSQLQDHELDKPKWIFGSGENYDLYYIPGKYGKICMIVPKKTTQQDWEEFHQKMVEIAVRAAIRKQKEATDTCLYKSTT